jgi:hypothetical protein
MNVEGLTNQNGYCEYVTDGSGLYSLSVSRELYVSYTKELCFSKNSISDIVVPLIPMFDDLAEQTKIYMCLSGDAACRGLAFDIFCPTSNLFDC